ncbi:hypothetical protein E2C01_090222 [Portunus trituberculatus]|uniref:Uncharacterized protein n=1 Tax=Portunus trituberculatus TaxID=210409 RepID=A0A5B7JJP1_PORTR|nr:hypothetical protein [Portunus trituberculatus]
MHLRGSEGQTEARRSCCRPGEDSVGNPHCFQIPGMAASVPYLDPDLPGASVFIFRAKLAGTEQPEEETPLCPEAQSEAPHGGLQCRTILVGIFE